MLFQERGSADPRARGHPQGAAPCHTGPAGAALPGRPRLPPRGRPRPPRQAAAQHVLDPAAALHLLRRERGTPPAKGKVIKKCGPRFRETRARCQRWPGCKNHATLGQFGKDCQLMSGVMIPLTGAPCRKVLWAAHEGAVRLLGGLRGWRRRRSAAAMKKVFRH